MKRILLSTTLGLLGGLLGAALYFQLILDGQGLSAKSEERLSALISQKIENISSTSSGSTGLLANYSRTNAEDAPIDFVRASERSTQSVVYIKTVTQGRSQIDWLSYMFGGGAQGNEVVSSGSGVIFREDGYIVTNNHVINGALKIEVLHGKRTYEASVIGTDPSTDLALLKVEANGLPAIPRGSSYDLNVGEWVLAVGNPFNLTSTVTAGIVSAKSRNINVVHTRFPLESFIQTDAAINPGNSGGALVNMKGELVGINTAILSRTGSYTGYGFAVPVDIVSKVVTDLIEHGEVQKAFVGAMISDFTSADAERLKVTSLDGVLVSIVTDGSAAEKAGLKSDDIILAVNKRPVDSKSAFDEQIGNYRPGDKVQLTLRREDRVLTKDLTLQNREGTTELLHRNIVHAAKLGADLEVVSKVERSQLRIPQGVKIVSIHPGMFRQLNVEEGFIITAINKVPIKSPEEVVSIIESLRGRIIIEGISNTGQRGYYSGFIR